MPADLLDAAIHGLLALTNPATLIMLFGGVLLGLFLGIVPGIGGLAGMALLLPFTYTMEPHTAFAMMLGMVAVVGTSDSITAVLFGVPGTASSQATILDGNAMARKGEAGRALSAAFTASLFGGLSGALLLALAIPILRPVMLYIGSPELLAFSVFGICMVAVLAGSSPLRGLVAAGLGILLSMVGADAQTGIGRWTMGSFYLWDGLPLLPLVLGIFALPELAEMAIRRTAIASESSYDTKAGRREGFQDVVKNWWLTIRCGALGAGVGAIPGMGSSVVDWIAYAHANQSIKGAEETFGKGDVRGVIAPESANNSITAGALVPTIAFGVPGSASMAILLGVFLIQGLVPGPKMLGENIDITYSMVWSIAIANILGAGLCFAFSGQFAKIATLRYSLIVPAVLVFVFVGAFQASQSWSDFYTLMVFFVLGFVFKHLKWPRPPLVLGFVLGGLIEQYLFISNTRYGADWLARPLVAIVLVASALVLIAPLVRQFRSSAKFTQFGAPKFALPDLLHVFIIGLVGLMLVVASSWHSAAQIGPMIVGIVTIMFCVLSFANQVLARRKLSLEGGEGDGTGIHMDAKVEYGDLALKQIAIRALTFLGYLLLFIALIEVIGMIPAVPVFVGLYMRLQARERWIYVFAFCLVLTALVYLIFDQLLSIPWAPSYLGQWVPAARIIPSV